jgi:uncharacterized protein (TIGR02145 family)
MKKTLLFLSVIGLLMTSCEKDNDNQIIDNNGNIYQTVTSSTGKIWLDRNLGASQVATSSADNLAYGDLYQWGRGADGHQLRNTATTSTLSSTDEPGHSYFIETERDDGWRNPENDNLWQGVDGTNNPCPDGYRLPTIEEWDEEVESWISDDAAGAFASPLKLPMADKRYQDGSKSSSGDQYGFYWSSSVFDTFKVSYYLFFSNTNSYTDYENRAYGKSVRCIKD